MSELKCTNWKFINTNYWNFKIVFSNTLAPSSGVTSERSLVHIFSNLNKFYSVVGTRGEEFFVGANKKRKQLNHTKVL